MGGHSPSVPHPDALVHAAHLFLRTHLANVHWAPAGVLGDAEGGSGRAGNRGTAALAAAAAARAAAFLKSSKEGIEELLRYAAHISWV